VLLALREARPAGLSTAQLVAATGMTLYQVRKGLLCVRETAAMANVIGADQQGALVADAAKGRARYYDVVVDGTFDLQAAWYYPSDAKAGQIKGPNCLGVIDPFQEAGLAKARLPQWPMWKT
jgi:Domain of unknown function (DUF427)